MNGSAQGANKRKKVAQFSADTHAPDYEWPGWALHKVLSQAIHNQVLHKMQQEEESGTAAAVMRMLYIPERQKSCRLCHSSFIRVLKHNDLIHLRWAH